MNDLRKQAKERRFNGNYNFTPRAFAQRFFFKLGQNPEAENEEIYESDENAQPEKHVSRLIFREGACEERKSQKTKSESYINAARPDKSDMTAEIYNDMLILNLMLLDLKKFNDEYDEKIDELIESLDDEIQVILEIYKTSNSSDNVPFFNQTKPTARTLCEEIYLIIKQLGKILHSLIKLEKTAVGEEKIDLISMIVIFQVQLAELNRISSKECLKGGLS